jgi:hypothetical protein
MINPKIELKKAHRIIQRIWLKQDIKAMALECIDSLCIAIEDGMDKDKALDLIYRFSHCSQESICYDSHEDWRKELKEYFKEDNKDILAPQPNKG